MSNPIELSIVTLLCKWVIRRSNDPETCPPPGGTGFIVSPAREESMVDQRDLFSLSEDELLLEIGRELDRGHVEAQPRPVQAPRRRGERFVQERIEDCRNR